MKIKRQPGLGGFDRNDWRGWKLIFPADSRRRLCCCHRQRRYNRAYFRRSVQACRTHYNPYIVIRLYTRAAKVGNHVVATGAIQNASSSRRYTTDFQSVVIKFQPKTVALVFVALREKRESSWVRRNLKHHRLEVDGI